MADADLLQRADALRASMARDAAAFTTRNVGRKETDALQKARDTFDAFPTDEELLGAVVTATEGKTTRRKALEQALRTVRSMAELQWGTGGMYKTFGFDGITEIPDNDLHRTARRVLRVATRTQKELAAQGLTAAQLAALAHQATGFDQAIDAVAEATEERDIQTQRRVVLGNTLYGLLTRYASVGKALFEGNDEARYNDYVILDGPGTASAETPA